MLAGKDVCSSEAKLCDFGLSTNILRRVAEPVSEAVNGDSAKLEKLDLRAYRPASSSSLPAPTAVAARGSMINNSNIIFTRNSRLNQMATDETYCLSGRTGSLLYMAPEVYRQEKYNEKVDVFSLAVIMYELFSHKPVLLGLCSVSPVTQSSLEQFAVKVAAGARLPIPDTLHPKLAALIADMWQEDPLARPSMRQVLSKLEAMEELGVFEPVKVVAAAKEEVPVASELTYSRVESAKEFVDSVGSAQPRCVAGCVVS